MSIASDTLQSHLYGAHGFFIEGSASMAYLLQTHAQDHARYIYDHSEVDWYTEERVVAPDEDVAYEDQSHG